MNLALFDLDYTLLDGDSDYAWGVFLAEEGLVDGDAHRCRNDFFWDAYKAGALNIDDYLTFALSAIAGKTPAELAPLHARYMATKIEPMITKAAENLIAQHRHDECIIVTATNAFVTAPIAARFGVAHLIACDVELKDGRYTGRPEGVPSFGAGKVTRVEAWLAARGKSRADYAATYFYSDSRNDLPLLEWATHPVAVNPDDTLRAHASLRGWPMLRITRSPAGVGA